MSFKNLMEQHRKAFWETYEHKNPRIRRQCETVSAILGLPAPDSGLDTSDPEVRKAVWRRRLGRYMYVCGMSVEAIETLFRGHEIRDPKAMEAVEQLETDMRAEEEMMNSAALGREA